ncbi:MAG: PKD domain-containing protein [Ferruginibacter sp.]
MKFYLNIFRYLTAVLLLLIKIEPVDAQMQFVENKGQWERAINYKGDFGTGSFFLENSGFTVLLNNPEDVQKLSEKKHGHFKKMSATNVHDSLIFHSFAYNVSFLGGSTNPQKIPDKALPTYNNYFIGSDKQKWAGNCKIYTAVTYKNIYPNIDVRYYSTQNKLKYDFIVHPGGDPSAIALQYNGGVKLSIENKKLVIGTSVGNVTELEPYSYQANTSAKQTVTTKYIIKNNVVSFAISKYDLAATLIIDPQLIFSSFTRSVSDNWGYTATPGADGSFFAGGVAFDNGYPAVLGAFQTVYQGTTPGSNQFGYDVSIFKFSPDGRFRIYATYIGGSGEEQPHSMIADAQGNLIVAGRSTSNNYPLLTAIPNTGTGYDIVVTKLNATGTALLGSVKIGGSGDDGVNIKDKGLGLGDTSLSRNYGDDARSEVLLDASNNIILASCTQSTDFPVANASQPVFGGGIQDGVILKFTPNLSSLIFSTFFGGNKNDACFVGAINPLTNNLYIGGATESNDLPGNTSGTINPILVGSIDGFVTELQPNTSSLIRTTYIGTSDIDLVYGLKFDRYGYPYIMGTTMGIWIPQNALYNVPGSKQFIAKLQPDLSAFEYTTNFGTPNAPSPNISPIAFLVDRCENVYVSGWGGIVNGGYSNSGTTGLPEVNPLTNIFSADGSDFYFFVLKKNAQSPLFGSHFGQNGGAGDHVDGGTSRFDANGVIYQAICANCLYAGPAAFPIFPSDVWGTSNPSPNCNLAAIKIDMNFAGVATEVQSSINGVLNDTLACFPILVSFKDTLQKGVTYFWNFNSVAFPNAVDAVTNHPDTSHVFTAAGIYRVRLISEDSSTCNIRDTSYITITMSDRTVNPAFTATRVQPCSLNKYIFKNNSTTFDGSSFVPTSFVWDYGDGSPKDTTNKLPDREHIYTSLGTYFVTLTVIDPRYCNAPITDTVVITVLPNVKSVPAAVAAACAPADLLFKNNSILGVTWLWQFLDSANNIIGISTAFEPSFTFTTGGNYKYRLIAYNPNTCNLADTSAYLSVTIFKTPIALFDYSPLPPMPNTPVKFRNLTTNATTYLWDFGDGQRSTLFEPTHEFINTGTYNVTLYAYNQSICTDTSSLSVIVSIIPLLDVPNAFTPGKFGENGIVYVRGFGIGKMDWKIYNRWGEVVFRSNIKTAGWNGFYKGKLQPMDVYTYTLDVEFVDGQKVKRTGDISLLH